MRQKGSCRGLIPLGNPEPSPQKDSNVHHSGAIHLADHLGIPEGLDDPADPGRVISADQDLVPVATAVGGIGIAEVDHIKSGTTQEEHPGPTSAYHAPGVEHLDLDPMRQRFPNTNRLRASRRRRSLQESPRE